MIVSESSPVIDYSEARWTAPRDDCPHPERWHSVDDESTEIEVTALVAAFVRALQPDLVAETGAAFGQTSKAIGEALLLNGQGLLWTCEPEPGRAETADTACAGLPVVVHRGTSIDMIGRIPDGVGFAWFDSLLELRVDEFRAIRPKFVRGAVVGFHDTGPQHGYRPQVEALVGEGWLRVIHLPTPRGVMFGEVLA